MDTQPPNQGAETPQSAEEVLKSVIEDLDSFRQNMTNNFNEDLQRLRAEKQQLSEDVERLRQQYEQLQSQQLESLSQRQIAQQQLWLKQLAQVLANNLQQQLGQKIRELRENSHPLRLEVGGIPGEELPMTNPPGNSYYDPGAEFGEPLFATLTRTCEALEQELDSYHSHLSQQLNNMRGMEQQGEMILETLVNRLKVELENTSGVSSVSAESSQFGSRNSGSTVSSAPPAVTSPVRPPEPPPTPPSETQVRPKVPKSASQVQIGLILALLSATVLSLFNVCLKILLATSSEPRIIFGLFEVEGLIVPNIGNSLLILLLRLIVVMLLMPLVATFLYPAVWTDIERFIKSKDFALWAKVIGSAFFLFLSQVLIYVAIGNIPTGIAITIFFIYPIITVLASWGLFGDRPSVVRIFSMVVIIVGACLTLPSGGAEGNFQQGILAAGAAGITFSGYVLLTQMAAGKLHPIPFSLVNFAGIFVFSALSLIMPLPPTWDVNIDASIWPGLIVGGIVLGVLTLFSYLLNNFAIRFAGAARASIIGTSGPALTALFAFVMIQEVLGLPQIFGMILVIIGVAAMSFERMFAANKKTS
ncbi:MAG: EamA family transporter [Microcoleaceae cyanobacterium MO_207.B10]|nr:EamA family transporter [Microcoleaceae cyanobacterium MO_207.B10]